MKKITFILFALIAGTSFAQGGDASAKASAQVNALIVQPISVQVESNMNFGSIATDGEIGTVILNANSDVTAAAESTASLVESNRRAALFLVKAANDYGYSISLPETVTLTSGNENMILDNFNSSLGETSIGTGVNQLLYVGGTLNVGASQPAGTYNGEVTVSVAYE